MPAYEEIYEIVQTAKSFDSLKKQLKPYLPYIDVIKENSLSCKTVASEFARRGLHEKAEWLRKLGANVTEIAKGYAESQQFDKVKEYRTKYFANASELVCLFAKDKHQTKVKEYVEHYQPIDSNCLIRGLLDSDSITADEIDSLQKYKTSDGYALSKVLNYKFTNYEHAKYATDDEFELRKVKVLSETLLGNTHAAGDFLKDYMGTAKKRAAYGHLIKTLAFIGNCFAVNLLEELIDTKRYSLEGYALAGNHLKVKEMLKEDPSLAVAAISGYTEAGYFEQLEEIRKIHNLGARSISAGYEKHNFHEKANEYSISHLLEKYINDRKAKTDEKGVTKKYLHPFFIPGQKSFKEKEKAVEALQEALSGNKVDLVKHLEVLRDGKLGKELRKFIKDGKAYDLVGKKVSTVSDFVKALQENVSNQNVPGSRG